MTGDHISGSLGIRPRRRLFTLSVTIDRQRHAMRIVRNETDTGWDVTCTCEGHSPDDPRVVLSLPDVGFTDGRSREALFRDACAEAWNHISGEISYAITGE